MELTIPVTAKEFESAGSKFITFPANAKVGDVQYRDVEVGQVDWDMPGHSIKFPVTVIEVGADEGKKDKISCGVKPEAVWKLKETLRELGVEVKIVNGKPKFETDELTGMAVVGVWTMQEGYKGGDETAEKVRYPKLTALVKSKPETII